MYITLLLLLLSSCPTLLRDVALARQRKWVFFALKNNVAPIRSRRYFVQRCATFVRADTGVSPYKKNGTLFFAFFGITIANGTIPSVAVPSLCLCSEFASGDREK